MLNCGQDDRMEQMPPVVAKDTINGGNPDSFLSVCYRGVWLVVSNSPEAQIHSSVGGLFILNFERWFTLQWLQTGIGWNPFVIFSHLNGLRWKGAPLCLWW